jgi:hypothetical protein
LIESPEGGSHKRHLSAIESRAVGGPIGEEALTIFAQFEDADEVDEACEGAWVVAGFGGDLLEAVAHGIGVDMHLLGGSGDVEVGVGEGPDRFDRCGEIFV